MEMSKKGTIDNRYEVYNILKIDDDTYLAEIINDDEIEGVITHKNKDNKRCLYPVKKDTDAVKIKGVGNIQNILNTYFKNE